MDGTVILVFAPIALNKRGVFESSKFIVSASIKSGAEAALAFIISQWPVASAKSIAGFRLVRDEDSWNLVNDVPYTAYVHDGLFGRLAHRALEIADKAFDVKFAALNIRTSRRTATPAYGDPAQPPTTTSVAVTSSVDPAGAMRAAVKATLTRRAVQTTALKLYNAGRISVRVASLIQANQVRQALAILRAERKYEEAKLIQRAMG